MSLNKRLPKLALLALAFTCFALSVKAQTSGKLTQNPCGNKRTCHECIQTQGCAWCMQPDYDDNPGHGDKPYYGKPRCFQPKSSNICPKEFIWNPQNVQNFTNNRELSRAGVKGGARKFSSDAIVQISPQRVSLKLRINQVHDLQIRYSQAEDYPVDLYYLMDLSKSMEDDKEKLSALGSLLSQTMRNITSNFRLGFGSFVDKVLMPYVSTFPAKLERPCDTCEAPYGYRNNMPLSTNTSKFTAEVKKAAVSGNLDAPEGGFDAIMQAVACRQQIGWREQARRMLVFSTDAGFHYAGDGKLGGVIVPNDGECHLNTEGLYTYSTIQDYPSISQINHKVKENSINLIFAVTADQHSVYEKLSQNIEGSSSARLSKDSSNVVDLVREEYSKISSSIEMKDNATRHVRITYHSACLNGGFEITTSKCDGLKVGDVVNFTAKILVTSCPTDPKEWNQIIEIYPVGINESLVIDLEMLCSCPCEKPGSSDYQINSLQCSEYGTYMCGICECDDMHFGRNCECSSTDVHSADGKGIGCRADNATTNDCNGRGTCFCGVCECEKRDNPEEVISGPFCECDNFSCDRHEQQLCSGPDHGVCECGSCICKPGWNGTACDCRATTDTCISPNGGELCSGHGECECGVCKCKSTEAGRYSGQFCEKCPTCSGRCLELKDCVQCQILKTGILKDAKDCAANCTTFVAIGVATVELNEKEENICTLYDDEDCKFTFKYSDKDDYLIVYAQQKRECPPKIFLLALVLGVIATIVLIGLAILLLWKLLTTIHDRREFAKFEKERMNAQWNSGGNPLYKPSTTSFQNPTYAGGK